MPTGESFDIPFVIHVMIARGANVKQKLKADYNTNTIVYGLSGYIGWRDTALYVKYDLNPIFKDNATDLHNVSLGLRFDMD